MPAVMNFDAAVKHARTKGHDRSVLLGNGFSMAYDAKIFGYDSLAQEARLRGLSVPKDDLFEDLGSSNFEVVVDLLNASAKMHRLYGGAPRVARRMEKDAKIVRNGLADVIAARHPRTSQLVDDDEIRHARTFLANFQQIFTLSYDLLLYWAITRPGVGPRVPMRDGFEYLSSNRRGGLVWKTNPTQGRQKIHYLHGALHLFREDDHRIHKLAFDTHGALIPELRNRLRDGQYPLVVTEGKREEKEARIDRSRYLRTAHRRFANLGGALFVHGVSMSANDDHVFDALASEDSEVRALYVGVRGSIRTGSGRSLANRAQQITDDRKDAGGKKLRVYFYDADSANVWR